MDQHIYVGDNAQPLINLHARKLTDGSTVWDIETRNGTIAARDESRAREAMNLIAHAISEASSERILHL